MFVLSLSHRNLCLDVSGPHLYCHVILIALIIDRLMHLAVIAIVTLYCQLSSKSDVHQNRHLYCLYHVETHVWMFLIIDRLGIY